MKVSFDSLLLDRIAIIICDGTSSGTDCSSTLQTSNTESEGLSRTHHCASDPDQAGGGDDEEALCPTCIAKQPKKPSKPAKPTKKSLQASA
jgi:hypothetical protein